MATNRLVATLAVAVFLVGVPVACALRLAAGLFPLGTIDVLLAVGIVGWLHFTKAIFDRDNPVDSTRVHRTSLRWQAHALVEASVFGAASSITTTPTPLAVNRLQQPGEDITDQLPPPMLASTRSPGVLDDPDGATRSIAQPVLSTTDDDQPEILATETYLVARGDTYWSIAEVTLGEGRFWTAIRDLNIGREVAPGIELGPEQDLRIGWSVLIPLVPDDSETSVHG